MSKQKPEKKSGSFGSSLFGRLFGRKRELSVFEEEQIQSPFRTIVRNFRSNKIAMFGTIVFLVIFLSCFILPIFFPLDVTYTDSSQQNIAPGYSMLSVPNELKNGNAVDIAGGGTFGIGTDKDGKVYLWGQMDDKLKTVPKKMDKIVKVSAGLNHVLALSEYGEVYTWGYNRLRLDKVPLEMEDVTNIKDIVAGYQISFALTEDGYLYYWGNENLIDINPEQYQGRIQKIAPNGTTAIALLDDGTVACLATKDNVFQRIPEEIQGKVVDIAATDKAVAALTKDGQVYTWGSSDYGSFDVPEELQGQCTTLSAGRYHFTAIGEDKKVYAWGRNNFGQTNISAENVVSISNGYFQSYAITEDGTVVTAGLKGYLMGTDGFGRDVFTRLISGGRMTMTIGAIAVIISVIIGVIIGGLSGYYGGKVDNVLMRFAEIVASIPFLPFAMILSAIVGNSLSEIQRIAVIMVILGVLSWPGLARLVRAQILAEREKEFVTAAKAMGIKELAIIFKHILPNVITVVIVDTTLEFAACMLTESSLSFLGFGVIEPTPTWGNMLNGSQASTVIQNYWWRWVFPSLALSLSTISINLIGDGLRDAIDPRSNDR